MAETNDMRTYLDGMRSLAISSVDNLKATQPMNVEEGHQHTVKLMYALGYKKAVDQIGLHFFGLEFIGINSPEITQKG